MFRERPLTWLFIIATVCVDMVLYFADGDDLPQFRWWNASATFLLGQCAALGAWLAVGKIHRLARGAMFVGGMFLLVQVYKADMVRHFGILEIFKGTILGFLPPFGFVTFVVALLCWALFSKWSSNQTGATSVRYSIVELLGWTIVVALASIFMREAEFWILRDNPKGVLPYCFAAIMCGLLARLADPKIAISLWQFALLVALEISCFFVLDYFGVEYILYTGYLPQIYFIAWLAVLRLDRRSQAKTQLES